MDALQKLQDENTRLRRAVEELSVLNEIATAINSTLSVKEIVNLIVQKCTKHLMVEQAAVQLLNEQNPENHFQTMVRHAATGNILPFRLDTQLTGWMLTHRKALLVNNFATDERFKGLDDDNFPVKSLLSVPLSVKGHMIGIISVFNKKSSDQFSSEDQRLISIIATQSAQIIENARLLEQEKALVRINEEMRMAHNIQVNLLPKSLPEIPGYDIAGYSLAAKEVGGDYYDLIPIDEKRLAICLGDVSGKGLPAAMLMANIQAIIRSQTLSGVSPADCMQNANRLLFASTEPGKFVTMFYGILDTETHSLTFCNAGHDSPYLIDKDDQSLRLETGGLVLGFLQQAEYRQQSIAFPRGALLALFSDGVTEAMNEAEEEFGEDRMIDTFHSSFKNDADTMISKVIDRVKKHADGVPQSDDTTMVLLKRQA